MVEKTGMSGLWPSLYDPLRSFGQRVADWLSPATEASSDTAAYDISMELPGVSEDDIELSVEGEVVTICGEKKAPSQKTGGTWYFSERQYPERQYSAFRRSFRLPVDADAAKASATVKDGVLHVKVPKLAPKQASCAQTIMISRA